MNINARKERMNVQEVLKQARAKYEHAPSHAPVDGTPAVGTVCVLSAVWRVTDPLPNKALERDALEFLSDAVFAAGGDSVVDYNANHTTEEVLATVFDRAIEKASV